MPTARASCGRLNATSWPSSRIVALVGHHRAREALDERRLAGAVVADHGEHLAGVQLEVGAGERCHPAEALDQALGLQDRFADHVRAHHLATFRIHWSRPTAIRIRSPIAKFCQYAFDLGQLQALPEHGDDQRSDQRAPDAAAAAEEAGAADHDCGDRLEVDVGRGVGAGRQRAAELHPGADRVDHAGHHVHAEQHAVDVDTGQAGGFLVVARGVHVLPPRGLDEDVPERQVQHQRHDHAVRRPEVADDVDRLAGPEQQPLGLRRDGVVAHLLLRQRLGVAVAQPDRLEDVEGAERDDERRQADPRDDRTVERAEQHADHEPDQERASAMARLGR